MPVKNKESKPEVPIKLTRRPIKSPDKDENPDSEAGEEESMLVDDVEENEDVGFSPEQEESVGPDAEPKTKERKDEKDKGPSGLYPEIPVFDDQEHKDKTGSKSWIYAFCRVIWILLAVAAPFLINKFLHSSEVESPVPRLDVDRVVSTLKEDFGSLHEKNFRVLRVALNNVNADAEPRAPAVLLVVSSEDDRFATRLAELLNQSYVPLSGAKLSGMKDSKKHIHHTIRESVEKKNATVFLVSQLQRLPFETTMIFHALCDDQNAPYKRVVYVITVTCSSLNTTAKWDQIGMDCLKRSWPDVHIDMMSPLITRLTPSVMILQK